jgi:adenine C2-methylase RlmN of 23S rRNA A2503 and tRNA A37
MPSVPSASKRVLSPASIWDRDLLLQAMQTHNIRPIHATTLWRNIIQKGLDVSDIPNLPLAFQALLKKDFAVTTSVVKKRTDARDGSTTKLLIELQCGKMVECCIMRYGTVDLENFPGGEETPQHNGRKYRSKSRATVCVSSQVGCSMGCTFWYRSYYLSCLVLLEP